MVIRRIEDIERDKDVEKRDKFKKQISEDINDVVGNVFAKPKKEKKQFFDYIFIGFKWFLFLLAFITILNLILGNIWLLQFFIKEFFIGV